MERISFYSKSIVLVHLLIMLLCAFMPLSTAFAEVSNYSNVLDDLRKADSFDVGYYPMNSSDYSISVIQIAESTDNELLVYTYQPSAKSKSLTASSINIAETDELSFKNYKLKLVSSDGVFQKYVVEEFKVSDYKVRYYYITSIYRPFDSTIDKDTDYGNHVTEIENNVSKQYRFAEIDGKVYCDVTDIETITITDKFVGFVRYLDGYYLFGSGSCDSHFVAFNTDKPIDKLLEADVYYTSQEYTHRQYLPLLGEDKIIYQTSKLDNYVSLSYSQKVEHTGSGWGADTYKWNRIETVDQFVKENTSYDNVYSGAILNVSIGKKITDSGISALKNKKWVLRFAETSYSSNMIATSYTDYYGTSVGDVTILRLKFETEGKVYNLGVIDNKQSGSGKPINGTKTDVKLNFDLFQWLEDHTGIPKGVWIAIVCVIALAVVLSILSAIFPPVWFCVKSVGKGCWTLLKGLWFIICLPFKGIKALIEKIKERKG